MPKLVLFDIDHTLVEVYDTHKQAFAHAFKEVLDIDVDYSKWKFHGYTDLQIIHEIMDRNNIEKSHDKIQKIIELMIKDFNKKDLSESLLLDGAAELLEAVKKQGHLIGLVTGNIEEIAFTKMKHFKIDEFFLLGGYGHISTIRHELIEDAIKKAQEFAKIEKKDVIIIGDTVNDINAAKFAGVKIISVATGNYSIDTLQKLKPNYLFENLKDTKKILEVIRNE